MKNGRGEYARIPINLRRISHEIWPMVRYKGSSRKCTNVAFAQIQIGDEFSYL